MKKYDLYSIKILYSYFKKFLVRKCTPIIENLTSPTIKPQDIINQVVDQTKNFTYEEKLKLVFTLIPWNDFHNSKYREEVAREALGFPPKDNRLVNGEDLPNLSLKSMMKNNRAKKTNMYQITPSQKLGEWGRIDLDTTHDRKDTICDIWGDTGVILRLKVHYDENFEKLYLQKKEEKLLSKTGKKNKRDSAFFNISELITFQVKYETLFIDENNVIAKFPLNNL